MAFAGDLREAVGLTDGFYSEKKQTLRTPRKAQPVDCHTTGGSGYICDPDHVEKHTAPWTYGRFWSRLAAEFLGTAFIIHFGVAAVIQLAASPGINAVGVALAFGFMMAGMTAMFLDLSGAFFNIIPLWSVFIMGPYKPYPGMNKYAIHYGPMHSICLSEAIGMTISQFAGAVVGAALLKWVYPGLNIAMHSAPGVTNSSFFGIEFIGTYVLNLAVLILTDRSYYYTMKNNYKGHHNPDSNTIAITIGLIFVVLQLFAFTTTGGAYNPFRMISVNLIQNDWQSNDWIYVLAHIVGGLVSTATYWAVFRLPFIWKKWKMAFAVRV